MLVLNRTQNRGLEIIDGQQRLTSLTMVLAALRNKLASMGSTYAGASEPSINLNGYINRTDLRGRPREAVLTLSRYDQESFRRYVQLRPGEPSHLGVDASLPQGRPGRPTTNRIREGFKQFSVSIDELVKGLPPEHQMDKLATLAEYIVKNITHITITVRDDVDAFTLFETVNYRGLDLSTADLLKNHLFGLAATNDQHENQIDQLTSLWTSLVETLEDQMMARFLRYFWISRYAHVTEKELYRQIKEKIKAEAIDPRDFLNLINDYASTFASLVNPRDVDPCALDLRDLQAMRVTQGLPFLMAAKDKCGETDFRKAVKIVETLSIRNTLVGKRNPNELERHFGQWARELREGGKMTEIVDEASSLCISDDEFEDGFTDLSELSSPQARYILRKIEWVGNAETQIASTGVEIEHVLPQTPNQDWLDYMGGPKEQVSEAIHKLGNLTLLHQRLNKIASAKPFREKCNQTYRKSNIRLTEEILDVEDWSYSAIADRQKDFATKAAV